MSILTHVNISPQAGPKTKALVDELQRMAHSADYSGDDCRKYAIGALINMVDDFERAIIQMKADARESERQVRGYGGR